MTVNWLDMLIGGILGISVLGAMRNGMTHEVVRLVTLFVGIVGAMWGYEWVAQHVLAPYIPNEKLAQFAGFAGIVAGCLLGGALIAWVLVKIWGFSGLRWVDRLLGGAFGLVRGVVIATALVLGVVAFAPIAGADATVAESQLAPLVLQGARAASLAAPAAFRQAYGEGFDRVRNVWIESSAKFLADPEEPSPSEPEPEPPVSSKEEVGQDQKPTPFQGKRNE